MYKGKFAIPEKKFSFNKKLTVPVELIIELREKGKRNLYQYCDTCKTERGHLRMSKAVQCCNCGKTTRL